VGIGRYGLVGLFNGQMVDGSADIFGVSGGVITGLRERCVDVVVFGEFARDFIC
jgi:hypothetical protein